MLGKIAALEEEIKRLRADRDRLDFLDRCNERLNAHCGTTYRWSLIMNHNVNRLMLGHMDVDLHDSAPPSQGLPSCRDAIDREMERIEAARSARAALEGRGS
ncbi:hypothetical protein K7W03_18295 [Sphingobium sp. PNB]|uniref:hypothetical protein n=1 Tax=Sphingobium sp. PNB TaxID=863934 RepID=UPI001CA3F1D4|nr:hypothetical protein [Sphingobium sp. PNB]MCB4861543.1 hypothetical protein [Sphingobium sp. PNB]